MDEKTEKIIMIGTVVGIGAVAMFALTKKNTATDIYSGWSPASAWKKLFGQRIKKIRRGAAPPCAIIRKTPYGYGATFRNGVTIGMVGTNLTSFVNTVKTSRNNPAHCAYLPNGQIV